MRAQFYFAVIGLSSVVALGTVACASSRGDSAPSTESAGANEQASEGCDEGEGERLDHIFYIMMENHGTDEIIGNTADAPYINELADHYGLATNYYGVTHPSLPNYLAAISGDFQGIWDDCKAGPTITCAPEEFVTNSGDPTSAQLLTPA